MWIQKQDAEVVIGATSFGLFLAGKVIAFTAKPSGAEIVLGRGMGTLECRKTVLAIHAPISFRLIAGNESAEERPALINLDPYGAGWMARGQALNWDAEVSELIDAAGYRNHILSVEPEASFED
jgi:glycine cleavage system H protein